MTLFRSNLQSVTLLEAKKGAYLLPNKTNKKELSGTPEEFKEWLGAPESYTFNSLKTQVLQKAIDEINLKIEDMDLEIFTAKRGRKVVQVDIHNNFIRNQG